MKPNEFSKTSGDNAWNRVVRSGTFGLQIKPYVFLSIVVWRFIQFYL